MMTDESGVTYNMPVAPAFGGSSNTGIMGGDWTWLILLFLVFGGFGGGFGGFGADGLYPWMNNSQNINNGFRDQMLNTQLSGIQNSITTGFGDMQTGLCGINGAIANASAQAEISANARQMANMNQMFGIQSALQQEGCDNRATVTSALRDVLTANSANTQRILDALCADKLEAKNDTIAQLRSELMYARGQASQDVQTAAIQAGQRALANEVEQYVLPTPRPAYIVQNPNCCTTACGCMG